MFLMKHGHHIRSALQATLAVAAIGAAALTTPALGAKGGGKGPPPPDDPPPNCCTEFARVDVYKDSTDVPVPVGFSEPFPTIAAALDSIGGVLDAHYLFLLQPGCYDEFIPDNQTGDPRRGVVINVENPIDLDTTSPTFELPLFSLTIRAAVGMKSLKAISGTRFALEAPALTKSYLAAFELHIRTIT